MTTPEIESQLLEARGRAVELYRELDTTEDLDEMLDLQRRSEDIKSAISRLESRLESQRLKETREAQIALQSEQDIQLEALRVEHAERRETCAQIATELAHDFLRALDDLEAQSPDLSKITGAYHDLFSRRFGRRPDYGETLNGQAWRVPSIDIEDTELAALLSKTLMTATTMRREKVPLSLAAMYESGPPRTTPASRSSVAFSPQKPQSGKRKERTR